MRSALVVGSTGLIGKYLVHALLDDAQYTTVKCIARKPLGFNDPKLQEYSIDFTTLDQHPEAFEVDEVFCCLGTTMRKAGSKEAFRRVDYDYPLQIAEIALKHGVKSFILVSSMGANPKSLFFYNKVKGEIEQAIRNLGFQSTIIIRPSLLLGERGERRLGEEVGKVVMRALPYPGDLKKYKPIHGKQVSYAMIQAAREFTSGLHILESGVLQRY
jgi:uncharacterized protein YbjT (DUF2867 family)